MTVLSAQTIRLAEIISPFCNRTQHEGTGCSYGLSAAGYDIRLDEPITIRSGKFVLASSLEKFDMPNNVLAVVHDKSTWARRGIFVQNTVIEPGWRGWLTLEISNLSGTDLRIVGGSPIAQIVFHMLDQPTDQPYPETGKYQDQQRGPVGPRDGFNHG